MENDLLQAKILSTTVKSTAIESSSILTLIKVVERDVVKKVCIIMSACQIAFQRDPSARPIQ
jgi:hypothetical protein